VHTFEPRIAATPGGTLAHRHQSAVLRRPRGFGLLFALFLLLGPSACPTPQSPTVTPHVARVTAVSSRGLDLDVEVQVDNPNAFALSAEAVSGTLFLANGKKLGQGSAKPTHSIPARGSSMVQSRVHVDWEDLTLLTPFIMAESLPYTFRGDLTLGGESVNVTLPFSLEGRLTRSELLQAGLRGL
jgi:LEA14-like dessication related protein